LPVDKDRFLLNIRCEAVMGCRRLYHPACIHIDPDTYADIRKKKSRLEPFACPSCSGEAYPFLSQTPSSQTEQCGSCHRLLKTDSETVVCGTCEQPAHFQCCQIKRRAFKSLGRGDIVTCGRCKGQKAAAQDQTRLEKLRSLAELVRNGAIDRGWKLEIIVGEAPEENLDKICIHRRSALPTVPVSSQTVVVDNIGLILVSVHGHALAQQHPLTTLLRSVDLDHSVNAAGEILLLLDKLAELIVCAGGYEEDYTNCVRSGLINPFEAGAKFSFDNIDYGAVVPGSDRRFSQTLRAANCQLLFKKAAKGPAPPRCGDCAKALKNFRRDVLGAADGADQDEIQTLSRKALLSKLKQSLRDVASQKLTMDDLKLQLAGAIQRDGVEVDELLETALLSVVEQQSTGDSASKLSPAQAMIMLEQVQAVSVADPRRRRYSPAFIRLAIALRQRSSAAYNQLSQFLVFPSERRLWNYQKFIEYQGGLDIKMLDDVLDEYKTRCTGRPQDKYLLLSMDG
jgi:hypothetical protein